MSTDHSLRPAVVPVGVPGSVEVTRDLPVRGLSLIVKELSFGSVFYVNQFLFFVTVSVDTKVCV